MEQPEQRPVQSLGEVKQSAVSFSGDATTYNIAGNYYAAALSTWIPPQGVPPRAQSFVGRKVELTWLAQQLTDETGKIIGVCGPGGMGKTALVAEAVTRLMTQQDWRERFPGGSFYYSFYGSPSLEIAFEELARSYGEDTGGDSRRAAMRVLSRRRTFLIFEGVENVADSLPLRQLGGRHIVLILSRRLSDAPDLAHRLDLSLLSPEQALELLQILAGERAKDRVSAERLVQHIGGYPLALQLIGGYLSTRQKEVKEYLKWFEEEGLEALKHGDHQQQSVPVLLQYTYASLTMQEQDLFVVLGLLAPSAFPVELIQGVLGLSERDVQQAVGSLVDLSVLRRSDLSYEVSHPLVHTFSTQYLVSQREMTLQKMMGWQRSLQKVPLFRSMFGFVGRAPLLSGKEAQKVSFWRERLLTTLMEHFVLMFHLRASDFEVSDFEASDLYDRAAFALWQPHVMRLLGDTSLTDQQRVTATRLFSVVAVAAWVQGRYAEAEPLMKRVLAIREQELGPQHPDTALSLNNLAALYDHQGRYAEAEPLHKRALAIREQESGPQHRDTADSLLTLALLYNHQGRYAEAEPLHKRALAIIEQELGPQHLDTATSLNNLAALYEAQGRYAEAEPLMKRALAIKEQKLGPQHSDTALSLNNLAAIYRKQGNYKEAEHLHKRALAIIEQELGPQHPDTATSLNNLAALYQDQRNYEEAEPLYKRALAIREQELGLQHPDTAHSLNNLATLYQDQGNYEEAEPLYDRALEIFDKVLGAEHPHTQVMYKNYALLILELRKRQAE